MKVRILLIFFLLFPSLLIADPGNISVDGTVGHKNLITINGTDFGSHDDNNEVSGTWGGSTYICAAFDDFESGNIEDVYSIASGYTAEWYTTTSGTRNNSTYSARRDYVSTRLAQLQLHQSTKNNEQAQYTFYHFRMNGRDDGKPWRWYYGTISDRDNVYSGVAGGSFQSSIGDEAYVTCEGGTIAEYGSVYSDLTWYAMEFIGIYNSGDGDLDVYRNGSHMIDSDDSGEPYMDTCAQWNISGRTIDLGYISNSSSGLWEYDDVYMDYTPARVMLCPGSQFATRGACEIQIPVTWSTTSIQVRVNAGAFNTNDTAYLYVVKSDETYNSTGYEVTIGSGGDTTPPVVTGYDPAKSETGVNKDTNIEFIVYDAANDVDLDTIVVTEEGNYHCCTEMTGTCPGSGTKDLTCTDYSILGDGYTVVYNPGTDYSYDQVVNVTIYADDTEANSMTPDVYSFTIESEPQPASAILKGSGNAWRFNSKKWTLE